MAAACVVSLDFTATSAHFIPLIAQDVSSKAPLLVRSTSSPISGRAMAMASPSVLASGICSNRLLEPVRRVASTPSADALADACPPVVVDLVPCVVQAKTASDRIATIDFIAGLQDYFRTGGLLQELGDPWALRELVRLVVPAPSRSRCCECYFLGRAHCGLLGLTAVARAVHASSVR